MKFIQFRHLAVLLNIAALAFFNISHANPALFNIAELRDLPLRELLAVKVISGTRSPIEVEKSPGIIRAFSQDEFKLYGFRTLRDVIQQVPGYQINEARTGHSNLFVRGVQGRSTSKILLIIDGVPMRDLFWGNFNIDEFINLAQVERIEFLNGPGSVLFGANAFAGVINITTKSSSKQGYIEAGYGHLQSYADGATENHSYQQLSIEGSEHHWYGFADYYNNEGFNPQHNRSGAYSSEQAMTKRKQSLLLKYHQAGFSAIASITDYQYPYTLSSNSEEREFEVRPYYLSARYEGFKNNWEYNFQGFINRVNLTRTDEDYNSDGSLSRRRFGYRDGTFIGFDSDASYRFSAHQLTFGISWLRDMGGRNENVSYSYKNGELSKISLSKLLLEDPQRDDLAFFVQDLWQINQHFSVTSGLRYSYLSDFDNQLTYRIGLTAQRGHWYSKLLFGSAFRVPTYRENLKLYDNPLIGSNDLEPEKLLTLEAQIGYRLPDADYNLTLYRNTYTNFIKDLPTQSINGQYLTPSDPSEGDEYSFNLDEIKTFGLELNANWYPTDNLNLRFGASALLQAEETAGVAPENAVLLVPWVSETQDLTFISRYNLSFAAAWRISPIYRVAANMIYVSSRNLPSSYQSSVASDLQQFSNADAYTLVNLNATARLSPGWELSAYINNVFDTRSYSQHMQDPTEYDIENPGRVIGLYLRAYY